MALTKDTLSVSDTYKTTLGTDEVIVGQEKVVYAEILPDSTIKEYVDPTVCFTKWNKEESLTLSYPTDIGFSDKTLVDGELKLSAGKEEFYFRQHDNDTLKFGLILNEKPDKNHLVTIDSVEYYQWQFQLKGWDNFDFFRIPEINNQGEFIDKSFAGGYNIFHKTKQNNHYRMGDFGFIHPIFFIDANKIIQSAILEIKDGNYFVRVLKEWADKAVYPIKANDTFGETSSVGYNEIDLSSGSLVFATKYTLGGAVDVSVSKLTAYCGNYSGTNSMKGLIFDDNGTAGAPLTLLGVSNATLLDSGRTWYDFTFSSPITLSPGNYWLGIINSGGVSRIYQINNSAGENHSSDNNYTTPVNWNATAGTDSNWGTCVYATYTASGTTVTPDPIALTASLPTLSLNYDWKEILSQLNLTASLQTLAVNYDYVITPSTLDLTTTLKAPTAKSDVTITPSTLDLTASVKTPNINFSYLYAVTALNLVATLLDPTVSTEASTIVSIDPIALTSSLLSPTVNFDYVIALSTLDLTAVLQNTTVNFDFAVDVSALAITAGLLDPTVSTTTGGRTYMVFDSANNRFELWVRGTEVARFNQDGSIDVNGIVNQNAF